jgi:hypothetical protein
MKGIMVTLRESLNIPLTVAAGSPRPAGNDLELALDQERDNDCK